MVNGHRVSGLLTPAETKKLRVLVIDASGAVLFDLVHPIDGMHPCIGPALEDVPRIAEAIGIARQFLEIEAQRL